MEDVNRIEDGAEAPQERLLAQRPSLDWDPIEWPEPEAGPLFDDVSLGPEQPWALPAETTGIQAKDDGQKPPSAAAPALRAGVDAVRATVAQLETLGQEIDQLRRRCAQIDGKVNETTRSVGRCGGVVPWMLTLVQSAEELGGSDDALVRGLERGPPENPPPPGGDEPTAQRAEHQAEQAATAPPLKR